MLLRLAVILVEQMAMIATVLVLVNRTVGVAMRLGVAMGMGMRGMGMDVTIDCPVGRDMLVFVGMLVRLAFDSGFADAAPAGGTHGFSPSTTNRLSGA